MTSAPGTSPPADSTSRLRRLAGDPRSVTKIWIVSAILNTLFLASILVLGLLYAANSNALHQQTVALHNGSLSQCRANNVNRQQDYAIWVTLEQPTSPRNAAAQAKWAKLKQLVATKDAPRDCEKIYAP
jgi:hypothetical protein